MDWKAELFNETEKPLDRLVDGYSNTSVFRTVAFIGDSLSSGEFETRDEAGEPNWYDLYDYSWGQYIARKNGLKAYNFSRGGMTAKEYIESFAEEKGLWSQDKACQAYVIALGVNDLIHFQMELGSCEDIDFENWQNNKPTFAGYYAAIIQRYKQISPDAKFFFVTFPNTTTDEEITQGMRALLYSLVERFDNSYVIDLYQYGPVYNKEFQKKFFLYGHMNPSGYILTAKLIDSYIDYIVRHNPDAFSTAGFIGTGIKYR